MDTKLLKQKILDLAIHGKLVPQNPNDESASKLLEKIREEKQKLIAEKKFKADKNDSYIFVGDDNRHYEKFADGSVKDIEDEIPFDVPEGWAWCRLMDACTVLMGQSPEGASVSNNPNGMEFHQGKIYFTDKYLSKAENYTSEVTRIAPANSLLLCVRAPVGVVNITNREICIGRGLCAIKPNYDIDEDFWFYWIQCQKENFEQKATGTTFKAISVDTIKQQLIPLPTITEQKQIVSKIKEIFVQIDSLETNKSDLQTAIKQAKFKILDLAIHGKLVPQDSSDEPASVLLERLREEKEAKIKAGELKRDKNDSFIYKSTTDNCYYEKFNGKEPVCIDEEIPFDIPDNWQWTKLNELADIARGGSPRPIEAFITDSSEGINWIKIGDTSPESKYIVSAKEKIIPEGKRHSRYVHSGDFLLTNSMSFGRPYILKIDGCIHDGWLVFGDIKESILQDYLYLALSSDYVYNAFSLVAAGSTVKNLKSETVKATLFPLPPISEQKRIVSKIEEIFERLDQIQSNLI